MPPPASPAAAEPVQTTRPMQAVLILSALYFLARFTGLLQRQIISALLPGYETNAYVAAFWLPDLLNYLVAGGAISLTFIPIFTRSWSQGREAEAWRFFSTLLCVMGLILVVLTTGMMIWTGPLIAMFLPGLTAPDKIETFELAVAMTRIILPAQLFFYLGGLLVGVLNSFKRFGATGWTSALNNLVAILVGVVLLHVVGPIGFAWGILLGAFVGNFLLPYLALQRGPQSQRPNFTPRFAFGDPAVRRFFVLALPIMLGVSLPVIDQKVVMYFASSLAGDALTHLDNAHRVMIAAQGVLGQAAAVAAFPYLASESAAGDYRAFSEFLRLGLRRLLFVTLPVSVLLILWAHPLTRLIYGYGFYNDPQKLHETAFSFALFTVGLFAWVAQGFLARGFYALSDTRTPTIIGSVLTVAFLIPLCYFMAQWRGAAGLALATTIGAAAYFAAILLFLDARLQKPSYSAPIGLQKIGSTLLRTGLACALMGLAGILALQLAHGFFPDDKIGDLALMAWTGTVAVFVFVASAAQFEIPEWLWLRDKIRRRRRA